MSGKDLFEGMSYVDECFVDEAENALLPKAYGAYWMKVASLAACFTLVLFAAMCFYHLYPFADRNMTEVAIGDIEADADAPEECAPGQAAPDTKGEGNVEHGKEQVVQDSLIDVPGGESATRAPEMMVRIQKMTDTGFVGTVQNNGGFTVFDDGTEITVTVDLETDPDFNPEDYLVGDLVYVMYTDWDINERTIVASIMGIVDEPICD